MRRWVVAAAILLALALAAAGVHSWRSRPEQRLARALAALDGSRFDIVRREFAALETVDNDAPAVRFLRGALLLESGRPYPALEEFGGCLDDASVKLRALVLSGRALYELGQFRDAVGVLRRAVAADPASIAAHRWLASAYYDLGQNDDAFRHLEEIARLAPRDPRPHRLMGLMRKDFERYSQAVESYRESLRRSAQQPDREAILAELAECHLELQENEAALDTLAQAAPCPDVWAMQAECHYRAGRLEEAEALADRALAQTPAHLDALLLKGTILMDRDRTPDAMEVFTRACTGYPKDYVARTRLIQACRRAGDRERLERQVSIAEELRHVREEFSELHEKAAAEPDNADVRCRLGELALELDRADLARVWFDAAIAVDPRHAETLRHLAEHPLLHAVARRRTP